MTRSLRCSALWVAALLLPSPAMSEEGSNGALHGEAPFNWTGFYLGAHLGGLANLSDISDPLGGSLFGNPNRATGGFAGAQIGYNHQSGFIVYGLEADISVPDVEGTSTCSSLSGSFVNSNCRAGIDAFGTLTARLGLALGPDGRALIYGKAGAAWYTGSLDLATNDWAGGASNNPFTRGSDDLSHWGWALGVGTEYALASRWSLKAEYSYADFGNQSVTLLPSAVLDGTGAVVDTIPSRQGHVSNALHSFKIGLNYRFGSSSAGPQDEEMPMRVPAPALKGFGFEMGARYWYSWGRHKYDLGQEKDGSAPSYSLVSRLTYDDITASTGEVTARITTPSNLFAKGFIGGGSITDGHMNDEDFNITGDTVSRIPYSNTLSPKVTGDIPTYGTIDLGYDWWRAPTHRLGAYVGYNYYRETMGAYGVTQIANPLGPFGSGVGGPLAPTGHAIITQEATWQSVRIGAAGEFNLTPRLKLSADAAVLPYVAVDAEDRHFFSNTPEIASINPLDGHGVGAQIEAMISYDITERLSLGIGARYWAMWTTEASMTRSFDASGPVAPLTQHLKLETERAGIFGQALYRFD